MIDMTGVLPNEDAVDKMLRDELAELIDENTDKLRHMFVELVRLHRSHCDLDNVFHDIETILIQTAEDRVA